MGYDSGAFGSWSLAPNGLRGTFPGLFCVGFAFMGTNGRAVYNATWVTGSWVTFPAHLFANGSWATFPGLFCTGFAFIDTNGLAV